MKKTSYEALNKKEEKENKTNSQLIHVTFSFTLKNNYLKTETPGAQHAKSSQFTFELKTVNYIPDN